jgi:putative endonuclease
MVQFYEGYHTYYVYIITNCYRSTFYIGMTNNMTRRLGEHKDNVVTGTPTFASQYAVQYLVYYEKFAWVGEAILREKELKKWSREKKLQLIRKHNPTFKFLDYLFGL